MEVELEPPSREGSAGGVQPALPSRLIIYVAVISALGLTGAVVALLDTPWGSVGDEILLFPSLFLAIAAVAGEVKPIHLARAGAEDRTLSTSAPFVLALVALAGVGIAISVQIIASVADDVFHRRALIKSLFNSAQYALSVLAAGVVYALVAGRPIFGGPAPVETRHLGPLLVAGLAMIGVNWLLVAGVIAVATRQRLRVVLLDDVRQFLVTIVVLLSVGGIAAIVASDGVAALVLLAPPVVGAHLFAAAVARHTHDATHDSLTGLGNRVQASGDLDRALAVAQSTNSDGPGLLLLDLDHFKDFNDTLGHPVGDKILQEVAVRLTGAAPETASVHRLGGDEFAVIVSGDDAEVWQVARDLLASFDLPFRVETLELLVRASIGTSIAPGHGTDGDTLMKKADIALYQAKLERDRISTYDPEHDVNSVERLRLLADLRAAPATGQLRVVYQPQVDLDDRRLLGVEALLRWDHPEHGPLRPDDFIPLAEKSGLINPLTDFVLEEALGQLARWRASGHELRMAINLSARHLGDLALPVRIWEATERYGIPPSMLVLEVTETGILADPIRANVVIRSLRELGVEISIDDYGTGNASLSYLRTLEVDEMKIDRSFIGNIATNRHDMTIVRSMIALALGLGLRVVAEGIEDHRTTAALRAIGGVIGQGHYLGLPVPPEQIEARLEHERRTRGSGKPTGG